jgi:hypothetical protein
MYLGYVLFYVCHKLNPGAAQMVPVGMRRIK